MTSLNGQRKGRAVGWSGSRKVKRAVAFCQEGDSSLIQAQESAAHPPYTGGQRLVAIEEYFPDLKHLRSAKLLT